MVCEERSWRRRLAPVGGALLALPLVLGLLYMSETTDQEDRHQVATSLCAKPPPCAEDAPEIGYAAPRNGSPDASASGFVLYRRAPDCAGRVEVYFDESGSYDFRGSPDDPDRTRRKAFLRQRNAWLAGHEVIDRVSCGQAEELDVGAFRIHNRFVEY